jgi:type IV pilus assembly protein PilN
VIRINLLPVKTSRRQEAVRNELILAGVGVVVLLLFLAVAQVAVTARVNTIRQENVKLGEEIRRTQEIVKEVERQEKLQADLQKKLEVIKRLKANKSGPVHMMEELAKACPEKLQLEGLDEKKGRIELTGTAVSNEIISQFLSNLEQSDYFEEVYLNAIDQVEKEGVKLKNFSITARLIVPGTAIVPPAPEAATPAAPAAPAAPADDKGQKAG